jgi:acetate kinase
MNTAAACILTLNGGSSSIKFALYDATGSFERIFAGKIDRIGQKDASLTLDDSTGKTIPPLPVETSDFSSAVNFLLDWLAARPEFSGVRAVGHRVVHGLKHSEPERITPALMAELRRLTSFDPEHLPLEILLIETLQERFPDLLQVACFDTAFHRTMPRVAKMLSIPRRYEAQGVERYGFHGLSYAYLMEELARQDAGAANGRVILAHLGNGASLCAVRDGKSLDTSMGFTPNSGIMMGTRSGDLDPGLVHYLMQEQHLSLSEFHEMTNKESGLLGVSETGSDIRDLIALESRDIRAAEAVGLFCYRVKKEIGALAAVLGGLDSLVFSGGIGQNSPAVRKRVCEGLDFLGIRLNPEQNEKNAPVVSREDGTVTVRVVRTDEERMIVRACAAILEASR